MSHKSFRDGSRENYGRSDGQSLTLEQITCGALLRISDATEAMAKNHIRMQADLDYYKRLAENRADRVTHLERSNAALRGTITKLKRKHVVTGKGNVPVL